MPNNKKGYFKSKADKIKSVADRFTLADEQTRKDREGYIKSKVDKLKALPDRFTLADKQTDEYKTGFFRKLLGVDPFMTEDMRDVADATFNKRIPTKMLKKIRKQKKEAAEEMADLEFELGKQQKSKGVILPQKKMLGEIDKGIKPKDPSLPRKSPMFSRGGRAAIRGFKFGGIK